MKEDCPLCQRSLMTTLHYEDEEIWVVDCITCGCPMGVIKRHDPKPTDKELLKIKCIFAQLGIGIFDDSMKKYQDHYHTHLRRK